MRLVLRRVHRQPVHQQPHTAVKQRPGKLVRAFRLAELRQQCPRPPRQIRLKVAAPEQRLLVDRVEPVKDALHARRVCDAVEIYHRDGGL